MCIKVIVKWVNFKDSVKRYCDFKILIISGNATEHKKG